MSDLTDDELGRLGWMDEPEELEAIMADPTQEELTAANAWRNADGGVGRWDVYSAAAYAKHTNAAKDARIAELEADLCFVAKWVERGLYDDFVEPRIALKMIAAYPQMPFNKGRWDVDHKTYAADFYKRFPKALGDQP